MPHACKKPSARELNLTAVTTGARSGWLSVCVPRPSWAAPFAPQQAAVPSANNPHVDSVPAPIQVRAAPPATGPATESLPKVALSCPWELDPQQNGPPSLKTHACALPTESPCFPYRRALTRLAQGWYPPPVATR